MADSSGWITIKNMVKEIIFMTDRDMGFYKKCMHYVINGIRDLNMFHFDNVKTVKVTCNDIGVIDMPLDYVSFLALSINDGGTLWTLTRRNDLVPTTTEVEGEETLDSDIGEGVELDTGESHGYKTTGGKNDYYYTIDERNHTFIVRGIPTRTLFLQYISSGIDLDDGNGTSIPVKLKKPLMWHVLYMDGLLSKGGDKNLALVYKREYEDAIAELDTLDLPTASELRDMIYEGYRSIRR